MAAPVIILMGMTGAGKTTQAAGLAQKHSWAQLSSGELLRRDPAMAAELTKGNLAPPAEVNRVVTEALESIPGQQSIVLDGFPRQLLQAQWLEEKLRQLGRPLQRVIYIIVSVAETQRRLALRGRADDSLAAEHKKYDWFQHDTQQVLDYYRQNGLLTEVDGDPDPETVSRSIEEVVG